MKKKNLSPMWMQSGVYKLNCNDCNSVYIGQTFCHLEEHESASRSRIKTPKQQNDPDDPNKNSSAFAEYLAENSYVAHAVTQEEHRSVHTCLMRCSHFFFALRKRSQNWYFHIIRLSKVFYYFNYESKCPPSPLDLK